MLAHFQQSIGYTKTPMNPGDDGQAFIDFVLFSVTSMSKTAKDIRQQFVDIHPDFDFHRYPKPEHAAQFFDWLIVNHWGEASEPITPSAATSAQPSPSGYGSGEFFEIHNMPDQFDDVNFARTAGSDVFGKLDSDLPPGDTWTARGPSCCGLRPDRTPAAVKRTPVPAAKRAAASLMTPEERQAALEKRVLRDNRAVSIVIGNQADADKTARIKGRRL